MLIGQTLVFVLFCLGAGVLFAEAACLLADYIVRKTNNDAVVLTRKICYALVYVGLFLVVTHQGMAAALIEFIAAIALITTAITNTNLGAENSSSAA